MTLAEAWEALAAVSYLPGWVFELEDGDHEGPWLRITATVPNAYAPGETLLDIHVTLHDVLAIPGLTVEQFYSWLDARLLRIAEHEHHEWFKVYSRPWVDPHAEGYSIESR